VNATVLTLATFNLCNLGADASPARLEQVARIIVNDLDGPDILALQEVKATTPAGSGSDRVSAAEAYRVLIQAITFAGGPRYDFREIPPLVNRDGGQADFNIRTGFLFNPEKIGFADRGSAGPEDETGIRLRGGCPELTLSPGRIAPRDPAFEGDRVHHWAPSRKALVGEFRHQGRNLIIVACHLKSQRAPTRRAEEYAKKQRHAQATIVYVFVSNILRCSADSRVIVLGDMNDVTGSKTLQILKGQLLSNPLEDLPKASRYTRRHGTQRQTLDHILLSGSLRPYAQIRIPHVNSDDPSPNRASDHDPVLATLCW
jgi:hypothetical protein